MPLYRRKRAARQRMFRMPGALHQAALIESRSMGLPMTTVLFDALAERLGRSKDGEVQLLLQEYQNDEAAIAAEKDEREARRNEVRA